MDVYGFRHTIRALGSAIRFGDLTVVELTDKILMTLDATEKSAPQIRWPLEIGGTEGPRSPLSAKAGPVNAKTASTASVRRSVRLFHLLCSDRVAVATGT
jgi:hypothetical protein